MIFWLGCFALFCALCAFTDSKFGMVRAVESAVKTKGPSLSQGQFGLMKRALARGEAQRPARCSKVKFSFVAKVRGIGANTLESARRSHGKFSSLAFLH
jgi:hypothetical protein